MLRLLTEAQGLLLDDENLISTLQTSRATNIPVSVQLDTAEWDH